MPPPPPDESDYDSAADSDFDASLSPSSGNESITNDDNTITKGTKIKKRKIDADGDLKMGSGDEGIVAQARKRKRKKAKAKAKAKGERGDVEGNDSENSDAAVGVRVKLRSGRGGETAKTKAPPKTTGATIDIDSVWARLNSPLAVHPLTVPPPPPEKPPSDTENIPPPPSPTAPYPPPPAEPTITVPHTYRFAGEIHTSTKTVPMSSPVAQAHLAATKSARAQSTTATVSGLPLRRPLARKNLLDPNPALLIKGRPAQPRTDLPPSIGGKGAPGRMLDGRSVVNGSGGEVGTGKGEEKMKQLNTVDKSKLDWEAEVERRGLREELERAGKSGENYLERMEFLGRADRRAEEEMRAWRMREREKGGGGGSQG
ncbi:swr complex subunit [Puttea exsequens]|nr:swr complex subunit [Puttea exsequens]